MHMGYPGSSEKWEVYWDDLLEAVITWTRKEGMRMPETFFKLTYVKTKCVGGSESEKK